MRSLCWAAATVVLLCLALWPQQALAAAGEEEKGKAQRVGDVLAAGDSVAKSSVGFIEAFVASVSVILVSEIGDKTFFIAAIMAMRNDRMVVFAGAIAALAIMTILSAALGFATTVIPRMYTFYTSVVLFALFGIKLLKEGYEMSPNHGQEELEEVTNELNKKEDERVPDVETGKPLKAAPKPFGFMGVPLPPVLIQVFTLTFLAEWGDRSQITTIVLAAQKNPYGVCLGGIIGHSLCTGGAVLGGRLLAQQISVRTVTLLGAVTFLLFAAVSLWQGPDV